MYEKNYSVSPQWNRCFRQRANISNAIERNVRKLQKPQINVDSIKNSSHLFPPTRFLFQTPNSILRFFDRKNRKNILKNGQQSQ